MAFWQWSGGGADAGHVVVCVHGLSRQGRDFDVLARTLAPHARIACPDVVGRGHSDWLADPQGYQLPVYAADMLALLAQLHAEFPIHTLDWVGTSMGGLIGLLLAGQPGLPLPAPVRRLVLNDVGPALEWDALVRIGQYLGAPLIFASEAQAADALWQISSSFGPHTREQWLALSRPMLRPAPQGGFRLHYDPAIAVPFRSIQPQDAADGEALLWQLYGQVSARTLLLRGAQSDLLSPATAERMTGCGPRAQLVQFEGVGHAPTLVDPAQVEVVRRFLLDADAP
ncbi:alpha/beta fold hydrolase [Melaminivora alkalimesophila]|uniref:Pimeloyl-ACP methyl ester carboxylesterase n=2 Tax=Melaminivora alkalimesophila TaxID=1165852 RepID=A0A317RCS3_9BURK|nr:alpha/beta hydrolase [Melaminivora alkalimesophila]PWW46283.1 pimeloyl-ACP methyl ester carboxylesterase [Melaminivora alkalimesophila]